MICFPSETPFFALQSGTLIVYEWRHNRSQCKPVGWRILAGYILGRTGLLNYNTDTPSTVKNFTIWNLKSRHLKG